MGIFDCFENFKGADLRFLHQLGFYCWENADSCDWTKGGWVEIESQAGASTKEPEKYREAFKALAGLAGFPGYIDMADLKALKDPKKLARVIMEDPMMPGIVHKGNALEYKKRESPGKIMPRHFRRLLTYIQMGLNIVLADEIKAGKMMPLSINGNYDLHTKLAIAMFQKKTDFPSTDKESFGKVLGRWTIGTLAIKLAYTKDELIALLKEDQRKLSDTHILMDCWYGDDGGNKFEAQRHIFDALKWLGYIWPNADVSRIVDRGTAAEAIAEKFKEGEGPGPRNIGPVVIGRVIDRIEKQSF